MSDSIQQQLLACPREVRQYVLEQAAEIQRLVQEIARLRIKCGPDEMIEGDYAKLLEQEEEIERLKQCNEQISLTHAEIINNLRAGAHSDAEVIDKLKRERNECRRLLREAWNASCQKVIRMAAELLDEQAVEIERLKAELEDVRAELRDEKLYSAGLRAELDGRD